VVRIVVYGPDGDEGLGTGFFVSEDGLTVTNFHVVKNARSAKAQDVNGAELTIVGIVATNPSADLAILQVNVRRSPYLELSGEDDPPKVGTRVYAIGNPRGFTNTLSDGLISGIRQEPEACFLQTTAALSPGSSGGPLVTSSGEVVGVTTKGFIFSQNLNFAVASKHVKSLMKVRGAPEPLPG
jgi:S1-C subfamily serine protease